MTWQSVGVWFADRCLPGLIDSIPFIIIVGFGMQWHRSTTTRLIAEGNRKQTARLEEHLEQKTDQQTLQIMETLRGTEP